MVGSMRAAVMRGVGQPLTIESVQVSAPIRHEVVVDVVATGLCHSDLRFLEGSFPHHLPTILGHEAAGVVREVGSEVTEVAPGDHVVMSLSVFCGDCARCRAGDPHLCLGQDATRRSSEDPPRLSMNGEPVFQFLDLSSFAETMLVHENALVAIDRRVPLDRAAVLGCGVATGLGAVFNTAGVQPGESVAVIGCGGVGLSAIQGARIAGAAPVIAIDPVAGKLELAKSLGATDVVDARGEDTVGDVVRLTAGSGVDHVIEAVGNTGTIRQGFLMSRRGGTTTVVGLVPAGSEIEIPSDALFYERRLQGSVMGSNDFKRDTPRYVDMYLDGRLDLDAMVTRKLSLDEINDGFDLMKQGASVRSIVVFD
jgi:S-(hydroxymethyl)glutathione dehydrogenase/alcohol dehydrogenase